MKRAYYFGLCISLLLVFAEPAGAEPREEFKAAIARAQSGDGSESAEQDSAELRAYVIYPHLLAARLLSAIVRKPGEVTDARAQAFVREYAALPVVREVRRAWLVSLAERTQWPQFLANYSDDGGDALQCHRLKAWIEAGGYEGLKDDALQVWMTGQQLSQACVAPFSWLQDQGVLTLERKEQRARLALAAGNAEMAQWLLKSVPAERAEPLLRGARLLLNPKKELAALAAQPKAQVEWSTLRESWSRLVRREADAALPLLPALIAARQLDRAQEGELRLMLALGLSWDRRPEALALFRQLPDDALDERGQEWRVRTALWQRDWEQAQDWLHRMPREMAAQPRWAYWRARLMELMGHDQQSITIYRALSADNGYYALLSAWRLGQDYRPRSTPSADDKNLQERLLAMPGLQRARELYFCDRIEWANSEWWAATSELGGASRVQAARLAASWGWTLQAAALWKQAEAPDDLALLYPQAFEDVARAAALLSGVPVEWIYAVSRQESLFLPQARSRSQALGLLQLKLDTALQVAKRWQRPAPRRDDLFKPEVNLPLGAAYLRELLNRFDRQFALAVGGYNAGPGAVARWLPDAPMDADLWIENVPYPETRDYIQKVLWGATIYASRNAGQEAKTAAWLAPIHRPAAP